MEFDFGGVKLTANNLADLQKDIRSTFSLTSGWTLGKVAGEVYLVETQAAGGSISASQGFMLIETDISEEERRQLMDYEQELARPLPVGISSLLVKVQAYEPAKRVLKFLVVP